MGNEINIAKYEHMLERVSTFMGDLRGKTVLEIGSDSQGDLARCIAQQLGAKAVIGVNPTLKSDKDFGVAKLLGEDARNLSFADNTFDACVSLAAFEHVQDVDVMLAEAFRVMKPGALLYTIFGPIWSGCWGHHLWIYHNDACLNYKNTELAPYCHLLMTQDEFLQGYEQEYDAACLKKIAEFIYQSPDQNRLFFSDYTKILSESPFTTLFNYGSVNLPFKGGYAPSSYAELFRELRVKYPEKTGFEFNSIFWLLEKPL